MSSHNKVLFLGPYPKGFGPSQRFRIEVYLPYLKDKDISYTYHTFYTEKGYQSLYKKGRFLSKFFSVLFGFFKRLLILFTVWQYDYVFVQREITPIGPPLFEWVVSKLFKAKLIYDFDDAIWIPNYSAENAFFHRLKNYGKIKKIIQWSDTVIAGNKFLYDYAIQFNPETHIIPTVIDTALVHNPTLYHKKKKDKITVGWTGTLTNNLHIEFLAPVFEKLNKQFDYDILLISNKKPNIDLKNVRFVPWDKTNEIDQLFQMDIGIMPLKNNHDFYKGKCGFKAIQYMSLGITTVATPLGFNVDLIAENETGYFATTEEEWYDVLP